VVLSYEEIKAYAASLALNLALDAPMLVRQRVAGELTYVMSLAISKNATAPKTSVGALLHVPPADDDITRALDYQRLEEELSAVRALTNGVNPRIDALITRMKLISSTQADLTITKHSAASHSRVHSPDNPVSVNIRAPLVVSERPAANFRDHVRSAIVALAARNKRLRQLLAAASAAPRDGWPSVFLSDRPTTGKLTQAMADGVRRSQIWQDEVSRWSYALALMY
jgi:hypothetical protein